MFIAPYQFSGRIGNRIIYCIISIGTESPYFTQTSTLFHTEIFIFGNSASCPIATLPRAVGGQFVNSVSVVGNIGSKVQAEVFRIYQYCIHRHFNTFIRSLSKILILIRITGVTGYLRLHQQISGRIPIYIYRTRNTIVPKTIVNTQVTGNGSLPFQLWIIKIGPMFQHRCTGSIEERITGIIATQRVSSIKKPWINPVVTSRTKTQTQFQCRQPILCISHKRLIGNTPCQCGRGENAPTVSISKLTGTIGTYRYRKQILVHHRVIDTPEEWKHVLFGRDSRLVRQCRAGPHIGFHILKSHCCREIYRHILYGFLHAAAHFMSHEHIQTVTTIKHFLIFVSKSIGIAPVLCRLTQQICLRTSVITIFRVTYSVSTPILFCIFISPTITKFRAESPVLKRLPIQTEIIILTERIASFIRCQQTFQRRFL